MTICPLCNRERKLHRCSAIEGLCCNACGARERYRAKHPNYKARLRSSGSVLPSVTPRSSLPARNEEIIAWYRAGWVSRDLSRAFGLSVTRVEKIIVAAGARRSPAEARQLHRELLGKVRECKQQVRPEKQWSLRRYLREVVPKEWYELAYLGQPDNPSTYVLAAWLWGMDDSEIAALPNLRGVPGNLVHPALKYHGIETRSQRESIRTATQAGRMRGPKKSKP